MAAYLCGEGRGTPVHRLRQRLPGIDCGACGLPDCETYAQRLLSDSPPPRPCFPLRNDPRMSSIEADFKPFPAFPPLRVARIACQATARDCEFLAEPQGFHDCHSVHHGYSDLRACRDACYMRGSCAIVCPNDAIETAGETLFVREELCTGCGLCTAECPQELISLNDPECRFFVACNNHESGARVHQFCQTGCLGCDVCSRVCPVKAIRRDDNLAEVLADPCVNCGLCALKCPTDAIRVIREDARFVTIDNELCTGCGRCTAVCPVQAVAGESGKKHKIIEGRCIGCGLCISQCPPEAIRPRVME